MYSRESRLDQEPQPFGLCALSPPHTLRLRPPPSLPPSLPPRALLERVDME